MPWWLTVALLVGSQILAELLKPKAEDAKKKGLGDFNFPTATERRKQPVVFGTVQLAGPNVVWYGDLLAAPITRDAGWLANRLGTDDPIIGYRYSVGMQMALCRGKLDQLNKIWVGDKLLWSGPQTTPGAITIEQPFFFDTGEEIGEQGGMVGIVDYLDGDRNQVTNAYLATQQTPSPAYRGAAYLVWRGPSAGSLLAQRDDEFYGRVLGFVRRYYYGYVGTSTSIQPWKIEVRRCPNGLGLTGNKHLVNSVDANPAAVLYEMLTDTEWGLGLPPSDVDTADFITAGETLFDEGNGVSLTWDSEKDLFDVVREIERQIDGVCYFSRATGKWKIALARGGYSIPALALLDESNCEVVDWKKGTWDGTINQVFLNYDVYDASAGDWKETAANASDLANFNIQGGDFVAAEENFPGVKNKELANKLAWRELRGRSRPYAHGTLRVGRAFESTEPGDLFRLTYAGEVNKTDLPIRVDKVDLGELADGRITLTVSEDVYAAEAGSFAAPGDSGWVPPTNDLQPIPTDQDQVFEAPRAMLDRASSEPIFDRLFYGARHQGDGATSIRAFTRHAPGAPSGTWSFDAQLSTFLTIGQLNANLPQDTANPTTPTTEDIRVDADDDTVEELVAALLTSATPGEIGSQLANLVVIDDEILGVQTVVDNTTHLLLRSVYRGLLDTVPAAHLAGAKVHVLTGQVGGTVYPRGDNVQVQLRGTSPLDEVTSAEANTVSLTMSDRARGPYPTTDLEINGTRYTAGPESLDATTALGSGLDQVGLDADFTYRDPEVFDQVSSLAAVGPNFPTEHDTQVQVRVTDVSGTPAVLFTTALLSATPGNKPVTLTRTRILAETDGVVPTDLRVETLVRHTVPDPDGGPDLDVYSVFDDMVEFSSTSAALAGLANTGARDDNVTSASFVAAATGNYTFTIGSSLLATGNLQVRLNGGGFVNVITTGNTTGTLAITSGDTVEWRHTESGPGTSSTHLRIQAPGPVDEAYGVLLV